MYHSWMTHWSRCRHTLCNFFISGSISILLLSAIYDQLISIYYTSKFCRKLYHKSCEFAMFSMQGMLFRRNAWGNLTLHIFSLSIFFLRKDENSVFICYTLKSLIWWILSEILYQIHIYILVLLLKELRIDDSIWFLWGKTQGHKSQCLKKCLLDFG